MPLKRAIFLRYLVLAFEVAGRAKSGKVGAVGETSAERFYLEFNYAPGEIYISLFSAREHSAWKIFNEFFILQLSF
jgi:hypothetical protein